MNYYKTLKNKGIPTKKIVLPILIFVFLTSPVQARDTVYDYSIQETMLLEQTVIRLGNDIKFYFGPQEHNKTIKNLGVIRTNKKTNAFNKSDKEACQWVFLSAMIALRDRARAEGGNAIINIKSNYKNNLVISENTYQCGAGALIAGVAFIGTVVILEDP